MCKYNNKCKGRCSRCDRTKLEQVNRTVIIDGSNIPEGPPGDTPYIGENGNWWIGDTDTGVPAAGNLYVPVLSNEWFENP